jgi:ATP-binding cassette subfamily F protein 3
VLNECEARLADPAVYGNETRLAQVLEEQARLLEEYTRLGGPSYEGRVRSVLQSVGFSSEADMQLTVATLSGGQKKLLGLAKLLIVQPDMLLLDEPDNHLDLAGKVLLERLISAHQGGVIIISHDRYLLDLVVDEIVEMEDGRLTHYLGDYSEYAFEKRMNQLRQQQLFQAQQKEIDRLEQSANRLLTWGRVYDNNKFIRRGKNILKRLERMEKIEQPTLERRRMALDLAGWRGSNKVLEIADLDKVFPATRDREENLVLAGLNLLIWHGERVGLVGPNGSGKSVLFRLIRGQETPSSGKIAIGPSVEIGYYAQEHETLVYERTLIETVRQVVRFTESDAVAFLGKFLFTYEQARSRVSTLSGGERSRLQMALLMLSKANFLLLDEPTNNLDIASAEVLEDALADFEGTVLVISHDRYFLDRVVNRVVDLVDGQLIEYTGGYSDYLAEKSKRRR